MTTLISLSQAFAQWQELSEGIDKDDGPALAESWNDYTDSLAKDGELCALQYHYAPAYDEEMPGTGSQYDELSDDREFILTAMGVSITSTRRPGLRREGWDAKASHWKVTFIRAGKGDFSVTYSMGSAHTGLPELCDVVNSLLLDASLGENSFADFCSELGMETETREQLRKAHESHDACMRTNDQLRALFTKNELEDLRELFADM